MHRAQEDVFDEHFDGGASQVGPRDDEGQLTQVAFDDIDGELELVESLSAQLEIAQHDDRLIGDAVFLAGLEGDREFLEVLAEAIRRPVFPLFLGRRSCPPAGPLLPLMLDGTLEEVFQDQPWAAAAWYRRSRDVRGLPEVRLETAVDATPSPVRV